MYVNSTYDEIESIFPEGVFGDGSAAGDPAYHVKEMEDELVTEESVAEVARRVAVQPYVLINIGDPEAETLDSTVMTTAESIPFECVVAHRNMRSKIIQKREARAHAWDVRKRLQGRQFIADGQGPFTIIFEAFEHIGTTKGLTLYTVMMRGIGRVTTSTQ